MRPLSVADIRLPAAYEPVREDARRHVIALKRPRRVALGPDVSLVFENRETVRGVVEELVRAERIDSPARVEQELVAFNALIPEEGELCATLFLEVSDPAELSAARQRLRGLEERVHLQVHDGLVHPVRDAGSVAGDRAGSVHYLRFRLTAAERAALLGGAEVALVADHPEYAHRTVLDEAQRAALASDLHPAP